MQETFKLWGTEELVANVEGGVGYCGKVLTVDNNGKACSIHYHRKKHETFFVVEGILTLELYGRPSDPVQLLSKLKLPTGSIVQIPPLTPHRFWCEDGSRAIFHEFSNFDEASDSCRIVDSGPRPGSE